MGGGYWDIRKLGIGKLGLRTWGLELGILGIRKFVLCLTTYVWLLLMT